MCVSEPRVVYLYFRNPASSFCNARMIIKNLKSSNSVINLKLTLITNSTTSYFVNLMIMIKILAKVIMFLNLIVRIWLLINMTMMIFLHKYEKLLDFVVHACLLLQYQNHSSTSFTSKAAQADFIVTNSLHFLMRVLFGRSLWGNCTERHEKWRGSKNFLIEVHLLLSQNTKPILYN